MFHLILLYQKYPLIFQNGIELLLGYSENKIYNFDFTNYNPYDKANHEKFYRMEHVELFCKKLVILMNGRSVISGYLKDIKEKYRKKNINIKADIEIEKLEKILLKLMVNIMVSIGCMVN